MGLRCHKIKYKSQGEAKSAASLLNVSARARAGSGKLRARKDKAKSYWCGICNAFHVGHPKRRGL